MEPPIYGSDFRPHHFVVTFTLLDPDNLEEYHSQVAAWCTCLPRVGEQVGVGAMRAWVKSIIHTLAPEPDLPPGGPTALQSVNVLLTRIPPAEWGRPRPSGKRK